MIKHEFKEGNGFIEAVINWQYADKERSLSGQFKTAEEAIAFVDKTRRKIIVDAITKFINHRKHIYSHSLSALTTIEKINALSQALEIKNQIPYKNLSGICRMIVKWQGALKEIMPSSRSAYYNHDSKTVNGLIADCRHILESEIIPA